MSTRDERVALSAARPLQETKRPLIVRPDEAVQRRHELGQRLVPADLLKLPAAARAFAPQRGR